jgi:hypothetical protein
MSLLEVDSGRSDVAVAVDLAWWPGSRMTGPCTSGGAGDRVFRLASRVRQQTTPQRPCISARLSAGAGFAARLSASAYFPLSGPLSEARFWASVRPLSRRFGSHL